jgi:hypothetical protein
MITIPPRSYVVIENPVIRNKDGDVEFEDGQVKLAFADSEIRLSQEPFPLYPGENLKQVKNNFKIKTKMSFYKIECRMFYYLKKAIITRRTLIQNFPSRLLRRFVLKINGKLLYSLQHINTIDKRLNCYGLTTN